MFWQPNTLVSLNGWINFKVCNKFNTPIISRTRLNLKLFEPINFVLLEISNHVFVSIFTFEMVLKMYSLGIQVKFHANLSLRLSKETGPLCSDSSMWLYFRIRVISYHYSTVSIVLSSSEASRKPFSRQLNWCRIWAFLFWDVFAYFVFSKLPSESYFYRKFPIQQVYQKEDFNLPLSTTPSFGTQYLKLL